MDRRLLRRLARTPQQAKVAGGGNVIPEKQRA